MYTIHTNVGKNRKPLVTTLTNMFGHKPDYAGAPTFAYDFGTCKLDRFGSLTLAPSLNEQAANKMASLLAEHGFTCEVERIENTQTSSEIKADSTPEENEVDDLIFALHVPKSALNGDAFTRFRNLVNGKLCLAEKCNRVFHPNILDVFRWRLSQFGMKQLCECDTANTKSL